MMSSPLGSLGSCVCISILFWDDHRGCVGHRLALWWKKRKTRPARHRRDAQRDHVEVAVRAPGPGRRALRLSSLPLCDSRACRWRVSPFFHVFLLFTDH